MESERLIAKYFQGQLTAEEKIQFDELMNSNPEFREQVIFEQKLKKSLFQQEHSNLKNQLKSIENTLAPKKNKTKWYLIAASIVVFISFGLFWTFNSKSPEKLFDTYYTVASNTSHPIVRDNSVSDALTKAFMAYESEQYSEAQTLFSHLYNTSQNSELLFYEAICYLEMDKTQLAVETFLKHKAFNDRLASKSNWYLALTYLKMENVELARKTLEEIVSNNSNYRFKEAKELLSKL